MARRRGAGHGARTAFTARHSSCIFALRYLSCERLPCRQGRREKLGPQRWEGCESESVWQLSGPGTGCRISFRILTPASYIFPTPNPPKPLSSYPPGVTSSFFGPLVTCGGRNGGPRGISFWGHVFILQSPVAYSAWESYWMPLVEHGDFCLKCHAPFFMLTPSSCGGMCGLPASKRGRPARAPAPRRRGRLGEGGTSSNPRCPWPGRTSAQRIRYEPATRS